MFAMLAQQEKKSFPQPAIKRQRPLPRKAWKSAWGTGLLVLLLPTERRRASTLLVSITLALGMKTATCSPWESFPHKCCRARTRPVE